MYKTRLKFWCFIWLALLCVLLTVFATLYLLEVRGDATIFNVVNDSNRATIHAVCAVLYALAGGAFVLALCVFIFYMLAITNNNQTIMLIRKLKIKFAEANQVTKEEVDDALANLVDEIEEAKKNGIELKKPVAPAAQPLPAAPINVINYNNPIAPGNIPPVMNQFTPNTPQTITTTTTTTETIQSTSPVNNIQNPVNNPTTPAFPNNEAKN